MSHPSRGAWIEIDITDKTALKEARRTPHGVRGLKLDAIRGMRNPMSRTPHGVRGLKYFLFLGAPEEFRRTPHGVRGLKFIASKILSVMKSHPSRGAWIEIHH